MSWLVVTPARNEADRLPAVARALAEQRRQVIGLWVVVDDGSTDGTADAVPRNLPFQVHVLRRDNSGGLLGASEFAAFLAGAETGLQLLPDADRVMKLDADVLLAPDYFDVLAPVAGAAALVSGRVEQRGESTRGDFTRGALKAYSRAGFDIIRDLPVALGWDVLDEVALRLAGYDVAVVPAAIATVSRRTGSSEGVLAGRRRAGVVSRWTGYHWAYFGLRLARFAFRRPFVIGSVAMAYSWATAGAGPFSAELRRAKRSSQVSRLRNAVVLGRGSRSARRTRASSARSAPSRTHADPVAPMDVDVRADVVDLSA